MTTMIGMVLTAIGDRISVLGKFEHGRLLPVVIRWQGRRYWVQRVNLHHTQPQGGDILHFFGVTTDVGDCTLRYSRNDLSWQLEEVSFDG